MALLPRFVRAGDTVIDIGAYKGIYAYPLVRLVGSSGHVIAYEPQPALVSYLTTAARWGAMRRVDIRGYALAATESVATLSVPIDEHGHRIDGYATLRDIGSEATTHTVQTRVLDKESLPGPVSFMKIDVEGHELSVLEGAKAVLRRYKPTMLIEVIYHFGKRAQDLAAFLLDEYGYAASELRDGELAPVDRSRWHSEELNFRPDGRFVYNFIFQAH